MNKCRRKYYHKYLQRIPENESIEMLLGIIVHQTIEDKLSNQDKNIEDIFDIKWKKQEKKINKLKHKNSDTKKLYDEYKEMALNWEKDFDQNAVYECEIPLRSEKYKVMGIIDEKSEKDGKVRILDNKTSKHEKMNKDYETQLAIYALLFKENFKKLPDYIGVRFLRSGKKKYLPVNDSLISKGIYESKMMKIKNHAKHILEYPRTQSILCNWGKGKCSYLERCFP